MGEGCVREKKFRYTFKHVKTGNIEQKIYTLSQLEERNAKELSPCFSADFGYELIGRDDFTGLKDKKDKEIYEGDIVDYLGDIDHVNSNVLRVIEYKNEEACFVARLPVGVDGEEAVYLNEHDFKVVGNIYENPELLEESA